MGLDEGLELAWKPYIVLHWFSHKELLYSVFVCSYVHGE